MRGLYAIVDLDALAARGLDPIAFAAAILPAYPAALQVRAKGESSEEALSVLKALRPMCSEAHVPLVANDRPDLALMAHADMVHVGQTDASPSLVRAVAPGLPFGISTHTPEQLNKALTVMPAYIAFGPVWPTSSKGAPDAVVEVAGLKQASKLVRHHTMETGLAVPLVAIGGITLERIPLISAYASAFAVISDLLPARDIEGTAAYDHVRERAEQYKEALGDPTRLDRVTLHE